MVNNFGTEGRSCCMIVAAAPSGGGLSWMGGSSSMLLLSFSEESMALLQTAWQGLSEFCRFLLTSTF